MGKDSDIAKVVLDTLEFQNWIGFSQKAIGQKKGEREEQHSLVLWEFIRFLWCSPLLTGDLLKLLKEDPGNSKDGELHWGPEVGGTDTGISLFPKIPIPPQSGWAFPSRGDRLVSSLLCPG